MTYRGYEGLVHDFIMQAIGNVRRYQDSHRLGREGWEKLHSGNYSESLEWLYSSRAAIWMDYAGLNYEAVLDQLEKEGVVPAYIARRRG